MTIRRFALFAAWTGLLLIVFVTVSPISVRPSTVTSTDLDRAFAFCVMSGLFVIAYPKRLLTLSFALFVGAFVIELTQFASMTRHPQLHDAVVKALVSWSACVEERSSIWPCADGQVLSNPLAEQRDSWLLSAGARLWQPTLVFRPALQSRICPLVSE